jgi:hypothetical protein
VTGARHPRLRSFLNFLLWYLGSIFLFIGLLLVATWLLFGSLNGRGLSIDLGIIAGSVILVTIVAVRCKAGFWAAVAAWVIGFAAMFLYIVIATPILIYIGNAKLADAATLTKVGDQFAVAGCLAIGSALLLNRWFARRRRIAVEAEAATRATVFD